MAQQVGLKNDRKNIFSRAYHKAVQDHNLNVHNACFAFKIADTIGIVLAIVKANLFIVYILHAGSQEAWQDRGGCEGGGATCGQGCSATTWPLIFVFELCGLGCVASAMCAQLCFCQHRQGLLGVFSQHKQVCEIEQGLLETFS